MTRTRHNSLMTSLNRQSEAQSCQTPTLKDRMTDYKSLPEKAPGCWLTPTWKICLLWRHKHLLIVRARHMHIITATGQSLWRMALGQQWLKVPNALAQHIPGKQYPLNVSLNPSWADLLCSNIVENVWWNPHTAIKQAEKIKATQHSRAHLAVNDAPYPWSKQHFVWARYITTAFCWGLWIRIELHLSDCTWHVTSTSASAWMLAAACCSACDLWPCPATHQAQNQYVAQGSTFIRADSIGGTLVCKKCAKGAAEAVLVAAV